MVHLTVLKTHEKSDIHAHAKPNELTHASPALSVVLPFHEEDHWLIGPDAPAREVYRMLQHEHALFKVVVKDNDTFLGIVDLHQISEQTLIRRVGSGYAMHELTVSDFMLHPRDVFAIGLEEIQRATVRDLAHVISKESKPYGIVLHEGGAGLYGVVCADYVSRRAKIDIQYSRYPVLLNAIVS